MKSEQKLYLSLVFCLLAISCAGNISKYVSKDLPGVIIKINTKDKILIMEEGKDSKSFDLIPKNDKSENKTYEIHLQSSGYQGLLIKSNINGKLYLVIGNKIAELNKKKFL